MTKRHTTLNIDDDVINLAKEKDLNMSEIAEKAIQHELGQVEITFNKNDGTSCDHCDKEGEKASIDNPKGICWFWPAEKWICDKCLRAEIKKVGFSFQA